MKACNLFNKYFDDPHFDSISKLLKDKKSLRIKGLIGSSDALACAAISKKSNKINLIIANDNEEASYFLNDIEQMINDKKSVLLFPTSHKKPYHFEETENANVLQRAEVLTAVNEKKKDKALFIVSYPEALTEKVINKRTLSENSFLASKGERIDVGFLSELLYSYEFEKVDFVYEAGQYSVRGGIIDVFSFSNDLPYRLELSGNEIESIRDFDPESQLSQDYHNQIVIIPNIGTKMVNEQRQSFFSYLPKESIIWLKDYRSTIDIIDKGFEKASENFEALMEASGNSQVVMAPGHLFCTSDIIKKELNEFSKIEFGNRPYLSVDEEIDYEIKPQPNFNKNFQILAEDLVSNQRKGYVNYLFSKSFKHHDQFETILYEINPEVKFEKIQIGLRGGFIDARKGVVCYTDHQILDRFHGIETKKNFTNKKALTLKELKMLQTGDFVVHIDHGIGRFAGLDRTEIKGNQQEVMRIIYRDNDLLYVSIHALHKVSRYSGKESEPPVISKLGSQEWNNKKRKVKKKVKDIAKDLIALYAKRKTSTGFAFPTDNFLQTELESGFMYQDTPDQSLATSDVKRDMEQPYPMDRLVCGDVGFGKTEVAIRAAFKAVNFGKQVAVLVPTTILALQHYHTFKNRLESFDVIVEYINRFRTTKEITEIKKNLANGQIDIIIGTHRVVNKDMVFKDLGLMVIDEEQKFGVKIKERLKELQVSIDALTLTATPIPRTLHFSLMGARDLSMITTPPPNRRPVTTELHQYSEEVIRDAVSYEIRRGGQVFFVHNRVSDIENIGNIIYKLVPDAKIGIAHGQMEGKLLEKIMMRFIKGQFDVLVSTNIIESGLDIPNANTIIINRAHMFGLSDIHQMRGRVGRSNTKAYCYLISPPTATLTADARKRLSTLEEFSDLGDGFNVAMRDLDIRGAGNLLGSEQSGFINDIGFDMYHKILDETVSELKETEFKDIFKNELLDAAHLKSLQIDCLIETDLEVLIPREYIESTTERLNLYTKLDNIKEDEGLVTFKKELEDRFGPAPKVVDDLIKSVKIRWLGIQLGFEKVLLKASAMKCYIKTEGNNEYIQSTRFGQILSFAREPSNKCKISEYRGKILLFVNDIPNIDQAFKLLEQILK